jgi:hypothetical protein
MPQSGKIKKKKKKRKHSADKLTKKSSSDEVHYNILTRQYHAWNNNRKEDHPFLLLIG